VVAADPLVHYRLKTKVEVVKPPACMTDFPTKLAQIEYNLRFPLLALARIRKFKPDAFYQRYSANNVSGVLLSYFFRRPFILEFNSSAVWAAKNWSRSRFILIEKICESINLRGATRIAVVSEEMKRRLIRIGVPAGKVMVNPNGVNAAKFSPEIDASRARKSLPEGKTFVGFIGIFGQWHGVLTLASAVKHVVAECDTAHFLVIGDGPLKSEMTRILERDGVSEHVTFAGVIKHEEAPAYLNNCAVLLSPHEDMADGSPFFGSPTKLFEYMAMGKGIVASRVGQLGEILEDGVDALLVEQRKPEELARAILRLIDDREQCLRLGAKAREKAIATFTWERNFLRCLQPAPSAKDQG
jgi:glycosyltransferase involved in cell wall biosynthesis